MIRFEYFASDWPILNKSLVSPEEIEITTLGHGMDRIVEVTEVGNDGR